MPASIQPHGDSSSSESVSCTTLQSANAMPSTSTVRTNVRERVKNNAVELELMSGLVKRYMEDPESDFTGISDDVKFRRANVTECVPVSSSDHVAEIVGKQGAKIKALRLRTSTYIKTPCRGDEPVFIITGRREDVMIAKQEILSAADQVSMLRARRSLQQVSANGTATTNASVNNLSVSDAIAASNLLAASAAGFNLVPTLPAAVAALNNLNAAAFMNPAVNLASMAALNATQPSAGFAAASLHNALLSNLAAAAPTGLQQTLANNALSTLTLSQRSATGPAPNRASLQQAAAPSRTSTSAAGTDSASNQAGSPQNAQTSPSNGVNPISLATMSNSRVLSRLALASGASHGNPMAVLNALGGGLLAGLPSYMPPGFNLATAKHIAQLRVPERIVGLVVGPRGATIKQIQQKTNTYVLTPSKGDRDAVFEIIGTADGCATAKQDIEDYVLSRTGMTVDQLLSQQSQVRALEAICQAAGLNVNRLVTNALAVPSPNVDLSSFGLSQPLAKPVAGSQLAHLSDALAGANPCATTLQDHLLAMGAAARAPKVANANGPDAYNTDGDLTSAIQSLLASLVTRKSSEQLGVTEVNPNDRLRLYENGWPFDERTLKGTEAEAEEHNCITDGVAATHSDLMNHSMFDAVYENLNSLVSGLDDTSATLVDREHDVPHYSADLGVAHHNAEAANFCNTYGMPPHSTLTAASRFETDVADVAAPERRSSASLKSLLAGLGLDTALCAGGPSSSGFASPSTSTTSGLGASLNGFASTGYQQRAVTTNGASSASSGGSSPAFDMFNSRGTLPAESLLHTLTAMRI